MGQVFLCVCHSEEGVMTSFLFSYETYPGGEQSELGIRVLLLLPDAPPPSTFTCLPKRGIIILQCEDYVLVVFLQFIQVCHEKTNPLLTMSVYLYNRSIISTVQQKDKYKSG